MWHAAFQALLVRAGVSIVLSMAVIARTFAADSDAGGFNDDNRAVQAIWLVQHLPFEFRGDTIGYTCESFKQKVRAVLIAVGVHSSLIVEARCPPARLEPTMPTRKRSRFRGEVETATASPNRTSWTSSRISAHISFATPAIANEQNVRKATTFDTQAQLAAQVRGEVLPTPSSLPVFPAIWAPIEFNNRSDPWLQANDCELLRQLSAQIFPNISVEVSDKLRCPASTSSRLVLDVKALLPMR